MDPPSPIVSSSLSLSLSSPALSPSLSPQSQGCAHRLDTVNRDAARAQRSLKMAPPRVLWIYPFLLPHTLLLLFHALSPCRALRNYPENEGECPGGLCEHWVEGATALGCARLWRTGSHSPAAPLAGEGAERSGSRSLPGSIMNDAETRERERDVCHVFFFSEHTDIKFE